MTATTRTDEIRVDFMIDNDSNRGQQENEKSSDERAPIAITATLALDEREVLAGRETVS